MNTTKTILPPIQTLAAGMPLLTIQDVSLPPTIPVQTEPLQIPLPPQPPQYFQLPQPFCMMSQAQKSKATTFTSAEDVTILKALRLYLGKSASLKVPWSFWQFYRKLSGSQRSDSSLYHHWNGAMVKKYGCFIKDGRIDDCIKWAESSIDFSRRTEMNQQRIEGKSLVHANSEQVLSPPYFDDNDACLVEAPKHRPLTRFNSFK